LPFVEPLSFLFSPPMFIPPQNSSTDITHVPKAPPVPPPPPVLSSPPSQPPPPSITPFPFHYRRRSRVHSPISSPTVDDPSSLIDPPPSSPPYHLRDRSTLPP
jgi:hypothetical protein